MPHFPPLRVDVAILLLLLLAVALAYGLMRARRGRRPPHGIRVDLVGGDRAPRERRNNPEVRS